MAGGGGGYLPAYAYPQQMPSPWLAASAPAATATVGGLGALYPPPQSLNPYSPYGHLLAPGSLGYTYSYAGERSRAQPDPFPAPAFLELESASELKKAKASVSSHRSLFKRVGGAAAAAAAERGGQLKRLRKQQRQLQQQQQQTLEATKYAQHSPQQLESHMGGGQTAPISPAALSSNFAQNPSSLQNMLALHERLRSADNAVRSSAQAELLARASLKGR